MLLCEIQALSHLRVFPIVLEYLEKSEFVLLSFSLGAKRQQKYFVEIELEGPQDLNRELFADGPFALADFNPSKLSISDGGGHLQDDDNLVSARIRKRARFASVDLRLVKGTGMVAESQRTIWKTIFALDHFSRERDAVGVRWRPMHSC